MVNSLHCVDSVDATMTVLLQTNYIENRRDDCFIMAALCNTAGHYIFALWFLSSSFFLLLLLVLFSSPNLSGRKLDVYHTSTHGVAVVRI